MLQGLGGEGIHQDMFVSVSPEYMLDMSEPA